MKELYETSEQFLQQRFRSFFRYFDLKLFDKQKVSLVLGQRGVGKTTLLIQYIHYVRSQAILRDNQTLYIQADHVSLGERTLFTVAKEFHNDGGLLLCIDEIHKYPQWSKQLKSIIDSFPKLRLLLSGSSILELQKGTHDLSRRVVTYHLLGLSFREYLNLSLKLSLPAISLIEILEKHPSLSKKILNDLGQAMQDKDITVQRLFREYLEYGYYPYSFEFSNKDSFFITLEQTVHTTIESDILSVYPEFSGVSIRRLFKLFQIIAVNVPYEPDLKDLKKMIHIGDDRTVKSYLQILHNAQLIMNLYSENKSLKALEKPSKIYLQNTNLMRLVAGSYDNIERGTLRETFFLETLILQHKVDYSKIGDFLVNKKYFFEVGGRNKNRSQIASQKNAYVVMDGIEVGYQGNIPLWLFGFLY